MNQYGLRSFTVDTALRDAARTASTLWCVLENPRVRISGRLGASGGRGLSAGAVSGVYTLSASPRLSHHRRAYALDPERRTSTRIRSVQNPSSSRQGISAQFAGDLRGPCPSITSSLLKTAAPEASTNQRHPPQPLLAALLLNRWLANLR